MIAALKEKYESRVHFVLIDVENMEDPRTKELIEKYQVSFIPTYVFFDREGKVVENFSSSISAEELEKKVTDLIR